jgi:hypothetical protein
VAIELGRPADPRPAAAHAGVGDFKEAVPGEAGRDLLRCESLDGVSAVRSLSRARLGGASAQVADAEAGATQLAAAVEDEIVAVRQPTQAGRR